MTGEKLSAWPLSECSDCSGSRRRLNISAALFHLLLALYLALFVYGVMRGKDTLVQLCLCFMASLAVVAHNAADIATFSDDSPLVCFQAERGAGIAIFSARCFGLPK